MKRNRGYIHGVADIRREKSDKSRRGKVNGARKILLFKKVHDSMRNDYMCHDIHFRV